MAEVQLGVTYPREVPAPDGLPEGWKAVEHAFKSGKQVGKTYIRFNSPHKKDAIVTIKQAIKQNALYLGKSEEEAQEESEEWQRQQTAKKQEEKTLRDEIRDEAIAAFRDKYGALDGATASKLPGWQVVLYSRVVTYMNPQGKRFGALRDIEASLGARVLGGEELHEVVEARANLKVDENGRVINEARSNVTARTAEEVAREKRELKRQREEQDLLDQLAFQKRNRTVGPESYVERPWPHVLAVPPAAEGEGWAALEEPLRQEGMAIAEIMVERHGFVAPKLLALQDCPKDHPHVTQLSGVFHLRPTGFNTRAPPPPAPRPRRRGAPARGDRPLYQQVFRHPGGPLACTGVYIFWSQQRDRWKIGALDDRMAPFAYLPVDRASPVGGSSGEAPKWWVHTEDAAAGPLASA